MPSFHALTAVAHPRVNPRKGGDDTQPKVVMSRLNGARLAAVKRDTEHSPAGSGQRVSKLLLGHPDAAAPRLYCRAAEVDP
jgi:hypothetical protein